MKPGPGSSGVPAGVLENVFSEPVDQQARALIVFPQSKRNSVNSPTCHSREKGNTPVPDAVYPVRYEDSRNAPDFALSSLAVYERA